MEPSPNSLEATEFVSETHVQDRVIQGANSRKSNILGAAVLGLAVGLVGMIIIFVASSLFLPMTSQTSDHQDMGTFLSANECVELHGGHIIADPLEYVSCQSKQGCRRVDTMGLISDMENSSVCRVKSNDAEEVLVGGTFPLHQIWSSWGPCAGPEGSCWQHVVIYNTGLYEIVDYQGTTTYEFGTEFVSQYEDLIKETDLRTKSCDAERVADLARSDTLYGREEQISFSGCEEELKKVDQLIKKWADSFSSAFSKTGCVINPYEKDVVLDERMYLQKDIRGGASCTFDISSNLPLYQFDIKADEVRNEVVSIDVYTVYTNVHPEQTSFLQKLEINPNIDAFYFYESDPIMMTEDVNFDGYLDIVMPSQMGGTGGALYYFWVYNPESDRFVFDEELAMLANPMFDQDKKEVRTVGHGGLCYTSEGWFKYIEGKLTLVRSQQTSCVENERGRDLECIAKELINGDMATTTCIFTGGG